MCYDGLWGLISDVGWSDNDASVVCNQLGYTGVAGKFLTNHTAIL